MLDDGSFCQIVDTRSCKNESVVAQAFLFPFFVPEDINSLNAIAPESNHRTDTVFSGKRKAPFLYLMVHNEGKKRRRKEQWM